MKFPLLLLRMIFVFVLTACNPLLPKSTPLVTATAKQAMAVSSPTLEVQHIATGPVQETVSPTNLIEPVHINTLAEAEKISGLNIPEPAYLPEGVSFDFATFQKMPNPSVTLYFKIIHPQYGDMGIFFHILQEQQAKASPDLTACDGSDSSGCELIQVGSVPVVYHRYSGGTEGLDWYQGGCAYRLLRTAGEPGRVYKDDLVNVVAGLK